MEIIVAWQILAEKSNGFQSFSRETSQLLENTFKNSQLSTITIDQGVVINFDSMSHCDGYPIRRISNKPTPGVRWEYQDDRYWMDFSTDECEQLTLAKESGRRLTTLYMGPRYQACLIDLTSNSMASNGITPPLMIREVPMAAPTGSKRVAVMTKIMSQLADIAVPLEETCAICLDNFDDNCNHTTAFKLPSCQHFFHRHCIEQQLQRKGKCPVCSYMYIITEGNQPESGEMHVRMYNPGVCSLSSFEALGTIVIDYIFPFGIQGPEHPHPGLQYYGTHRQAFLPDNPEGREVLALLKRCFELRHTFTVGRSLTTGRDNCIVWNGVHHKTSPCGGTAHFGWPDETYFFRVKEELKARGIE